MIFGEKTSAKFLERWPTVFMQKVIQQSKGLHVSQELQDLIDSAESAVGSETDVEGWTIGVHKISSCRYCMCMFCLLILPSFLGWGRDLASIILLLHLIPPSPQGRKRPGKMSASQAEKHLVIFKKVHLLFLFLPVCKLD